MKFFKTKTAKSIINYSLNPLASMRNPLTRLQSMLEKSNQEKIPYTEFKLDKLDSFNIEQKCKQLKTMSRIAFCGASLLVFSCLILIIFHQISFGLIFEAITSLCFASMLSVFSLKYAFLAHAVENRQFKYKNPLEYMKRNARTYFAWLMANKYQTQSSFK